jgi:hypothetical protein
LLNEALRPVLIIVPGHAIRHRAMLGIDRAISRLMVSLALYCIFIARALTGIVRE